MPSPSSERRFFLSWPGLIVLLFLYWIRASRLHLHLKPGLNFPTWIHPALRWRLLVMMPVLSACHGLWGAPLTPPSTITPPYTGAFPLLDCRLPPGSSVPPDREPHLSSHQRIPPCLSPHKYSLSQSWVPAL